MNSSVKSIIIGFSLLVIWGVVAYEYTTFSKSTWNIPLHNVVSEPEIPLVLEPQRDLISDTSFQKFLNEEHGFQNQKFEPEDLSPIDSDFTFNNARKFKLRKEAGDSFADLAWHFWDHFKGKKKLNITSAYRSFQHQEYLKNHYCRKNQCAEPWSSEHQAWLAIDLGTNGRTLDQLSLQRLQENAHKRGFHNTYQKGVEVDGKMVEPWHWRYLWVELATELYEKKQSFSEWYIQQSNEAPDFESPSTWMVEEKDKIENFLDNEKLIEKVTKIGLTSDDSFQRFLDEKHPFNELNYEPKDLKSLQSDFTSNNVTSYQLRAKAWEAFSDMAWHFWNENGKRRKLTVFSAYRSYRYQQWIQMRWCPNTECASPWTSEHQAGLAVDLKVNGKELTENDLKRLQDNAHRFGFSNSYTRGVAKDGKIIEPRHWRFLWIELASELYEKQINFTQRYYELEKER